MKADDMKCIRIESDLLHPLFWGRDAAVLLFSTIMWKYWIHNNDGVRLFFVVVDRSDPIRSRLLESPLPVSVGAAQAMP
jgi:hypothetical protein